MNKTAVITGGTKGIGRALIQTFLEQGFNVVTCARNKDDLQNLKDYTLKHFSYQRVDTRQIDISIKDEVLQFGDFIIDKYNKIDVLINNAGIFIPGQIHKEKDGIIERLINTNLYSAYHLTRKIIPVMIAVGQGHIFNICSVASIKSYPNGGSYSISKFALLGFSKCLRDELKEHNIKVTSVMPGATWSNSWQGVDLPEERLMPAKDISKTIWSAYQLSKSSVVEEIILRPQLGDL